MNKKVLVPGTIYWLLRWQHTYLRDGFQQPTVDDRLVLRVDRVSCALDFLSPSCRCRRLRSLWPGVAFRPLQL